ncbi:MAG: hypothetical protein AAGI09_11820 [Pseudomonadota bacterium]
MAIIVYRTSGGGLEVIEQNLPHTVPGWIPDNAVEIAAIDALTVVPPFAAQTIARPELYQRRVVDDAYSWHIKDLIVKDPVTGSVYVSTQSMVTGAQAINVRSAEWVQERQVVYNDNLVTAYQPDDHNAGALYYFEGKLIVGATGHGTTNEIYIFESADTTPDSLGAPTILTPNSNCTYVQFVEVGGVLYVAARDGTRNWAMFRRDGPGAWTTLADPITSDNQTYANMESVGSTVRAVCWDHPTTSGEGRRGIVYLHEFTPGDPTQDITLLSQAYTPATGRSARVLDFARDSSAILICDFEVGNEAGQIYKVLRWSGNGSWTDSAEWSEEIVGGTDQSFFTPSNYVAGGCIANLDGTLLWTVENTSGSEVKYWTKAGAWSSITVATSSKFLARPICDPNNRGAAIVQDLVRYDDFDSAEIDTFCVFSDESFGVNDWAEPAPPIEGIRGSVQVAEYFVGADIDLFAHNFDLSLAQPGDTLRVVSISRDGDAPDFRMDGNAMTIETINPSSTSVRVAVSNILFDPAMTGAFEMETDTTASYHRVMLAIVKPGWAVVEGGQSPTCQVGDMVLGGAHSSNDANAQHVYSSDTQIDLSAHGDTGTTKTSFSAGIVESGNEGVVSVTDLGSANSHYVALVLRQS